MTQSDYLLRDSVQCSMAIVQLPQFIQVRHQTLVRNIAIKSKRTLDRLDSGGRAGSGRSAQALRKELKGTLEDVGPREDQKHNCRRDIQR
jgi:hypothetical protein